MPSLVDKATKTLQVYWWVFLFHMSNFLLRLKTDMQLFMGTLVTCVIMQKNGAGLHTAR